MKLSFHPILDPVAFSKNIRGDYKFFANWVGKGQLSPEFKWYEVRDGGEQVALLELDLSPNRNYWKGSVYDLPMEGPDIVEIQFIDVSATHRGRGVGTAVVHWVAEQYPERQIIALAEDSDGFWQSLGWELIGPPDSGYRPMYVSPL